jgi:antagonist of KipI
LSVPLLHILKPGFLTTVQDRGRPFYQWEGVSMSGALDAFSYRIGNLLVGNSENAAGLEMTVSGPTLAILRDSLIAITGANITPRKNGYPLPMWTTVRVRQGDLVTFGPLKEGCKGYLSVRSGISLPPLLGSRSTNLSSREGGKEGRPLRMGDVLESEHFGHAALFEGRTLPRELIPRYGRNLVARVIMGPQTRYFESQYGIQTFLQSEYVVSSQISRAGYRLDGPAIALRHGVETSIPSEGCCPGGIQVPESGKPIVLMVEQHGGGYPKIAVIISADLNFLAQLRPGDKIRFEKISLARAHEISLKKEAAIRAWKMECDSVYH